jgi:hypothetical protein
MVTARVQHLWAVAAVVGADIVNSPCELEHGVITGDFDKIGLNHIWVFTCAEMY